jgi:hypothetical protein
MAAEAGAPEIAAHAAETARSTEAAAEAMAREAMKAAAAEVPARSGRPCALASEVESSRAAASVAMFIRVVMVVKPFDGPG